ncbi:MAG: response regulator [Vulcanimicrobiaceae bacterium]
MRLLIVDDAAVMRTLLVRQLASLGHQVVGAVADLASALELAAEARPDAILLDGRLGGCAGGEAIAALRARAPSSAIVVVGALGERASLRAFIAAGAQAALPRPPLLSHLRRVIATLGASQGERGG